MEDQNTQVHTLSADVIATIAKLLQLAMLTGTDLYDHLKTLQLVSRDQQLYLSDVFQQKLEEEIARLTEKASTLPLAQLQVGFNNVS